MSSSDLYEEIREIQEEFCAWLNEIITQLIEADEPSVVYRFIVDQLSQADMDEKEIEELVLHSLHDHGLNDEEAMPLIGKKVIDFESEREEAIFWTCYHNLPKEPSYTFRRKGKKRPTPPKHNEKRSLIHRSEKKVRQQGRRYQFTLPVQVTQPVKVQWRKKDYVEVSELDANLRYELDCIPIKYVQERAKHLHTEEFHRYLMDRLKQREAERIKRFGPYCYNVYYPDGELMDEHDYYEEEIRFHRCYM